MYSQLDALALINRYQPDHEDEQKHQRFIAQFIESNQRYWARDTLFGHLTASAWITSNDQTKAVLLHHKKLNLWVQPGGHIDESDASLMAASLREATEETGLSALQPVSHDIFDIDVHRIPVRKQEPEHWHLDIRFWFKTDNDVLTISEESNHLMWLSKQDIFNRTDEESVLRMVRKTLS